MVKKYYKQIENDYIMSIGTDHGAIEITEEEYNSILSLIQNRPQADGKGYRLKTDLTWEEYDLPAPPEPLDDDELNETETLSILLGGEVE